MKHALRKYIAPCGSALFMVVSTMAALVVLVTAMYMSVVSSRQVQYAEFYQEQAYVSSTSIADIIGSYIADSKNSGSSLVKKILNLKEGESVSTLNGNDFASLSPSGTKDDTLLGGYTVDIVRMKDETIAGTTWHIYDVAVTVSTNELVETTHTFIRTKDPEPSKMDRIDRFFTNTGYLPNDVWISSVTTDSTLFCDNEYTIFSKDINTDRFGGGGDIIYNMDITCAGAAIIDSKAQIKNVEKPLTWSVGNNFTVGNNCSIGTFNLGGTSSEHAKIVVGGDFFINGNRTFADKTDVYVLGNVYLGGCVEFEGDLYVGGDIIFDTTSWCSFGDVYIDGMIRALDGAATNINSISSQQAWGDSSTWSDFLDYTIGGSVYPKWIIDTADFDVENIVFDTNDSTFKENAKYIHFIDHDCTIGEVRDAYDGNGQSVNLTVVIDTGDDPEGIRTLSVEANCDDVGVDNTFMWYPEASPSGGKTITILTVGRGTLVIDVPEGVTYQASDQEFFGHIGWFMIAGGKISKTSYGAPYFDRSGINLVNMGDVITDNDFIYPGSGDTCNYVIEDTEKNLYTCEQHGGSYEEIDVKDVESGKVDTLCAGRILDYELDSYFASHSGVLSEIKEYYEDFFGTSRDSNSGYSSDCYYPNVDIFIVSSLENADIQFGVKKATDSSVQNNVYFGYVYAPYMTFVSVGSGGGLKSVGGLIVSDMAVNGSYKYLFAQPSRSIQQIVGDDFEKLLPSGNRSWRIHGV